MGCTPLQGARCTLFPAASCFAGFAMFTQQTNSTRSRFHVMHAWALVFLASLCLGGMGRSLPGVEPEPTAPAISGSARTEGADGRSGPLRTLDDEFLFEPSSSLGAWNPRAEKLRDRLLVASGLSPLLSKRPLSPQVFGLVERDDYTVEKVILETLPGHFLTGSLYRPKNVSGPSPAILCPHGHWENGRFQRASDEEVKKSLEQNAERFENAARHPLQARCVQLCRMGFVVFHYDMEGYADNQQLTHRPKPEVRTAMCGDTDWGFFSPQAESRLFSMFGLQTWNGLRALDWLVTLPDVDATRIGMTGASGGGTQTFVLSALDPRICCAFPAVMVSTAMQGGCTCENACYLRVQAGNVDYAALIAPRPLGMTGADDWTREIMTKGYPELQRHYGLFGAADRVHAEAFPQFEHNFNGVSGEVVYAWMAKHLRPKRADDRLQRDFSPLTQEEMSVWDSSHPRPPAGDAHEKSLLAYMKQDLERVQADLAPADAGKWARYREQMGHGWQVLIGRTPDDYHDVRFVEESKHQAGEAWVFTGLLERPSWKESSSCCFVYPEKWNGAVTIVVDPAGCRAVLDEAGKLTPRAGEIASHGTALAILDWFEPEATQASSAEDERPQTTPLLARAVNDPKGWDGQAAAYTYGYNHPVFAQRVHDVLALLSFVARHERSPQKIWLCGGRGAGPHALAAGALAHGTSPGILLTGVSADLGDFCFDDVRNVRDLDFLPGSVRFGDVSCLAALCAPLPLHLQGAKIDERLVEQAYTADGAAEKLKIFATNPGSKQLEWLGNGGAVQ